MSTLNTLRTSGQYFTREESLPQIREEEIGYNIDEMKTIKTSESEFESLIRSGSLYVDKTMYIARLLRMGESYYFLSRPRRYGKSLFCSTLQALFEGKRELFEGLYIAEKTDYGFESFPVLHFNFANLSVTTLDEFLRTFSKAVYGESVRLGLSIERSLNPADMLQDILYSLGRPAVIIVDEYDFPLIKAMNDELPFLKEMRSYFRDFYSRIKNNGKYIRFFFITGVTKYSNLSIFSEMNNLTDISMDPRFASAFGYTEDELLGYFGEAIDEHYEENRDRYGSRDELVERIREYYDGYRFSPDTEITVYNPVSIGRFFNNGCRFDNYWDQTGVSSLAVKTAMNYDLTSIVEEGIVVDKSSFTAFDISQITEHRMRSSSVVLLMYYTGYLTIKSAKGTLLTLGFPNTEVGSSFSLSLSSWYAANEMKVKTLPAIGKDAAERGDTDGLMEVLNDWYEQCSSQVLSARFEQPYQLMMHMFFISAGCPATVEEGTALGRIDNSMKAGRNIYLFELKVDESPDKALSQIKEKRYYGKFMPSVKKGYAVHLVGVSISSRERKIESYKEEVIQN